MKRIGGRWRVVGAILVAIILATVVYVVWRSSSVRTMSQEDAARKVESYAQATATMIGETKLQNSSTLPSKCEGRMGEFARDGRFYVRGYYNVRLPGGAAQVATVERLRDEWKNQGFDVKEYRIDGDNEAHLTVVNPADEFQILLSPTDTPEWLALWVTTPCLAPPK